MADRVWLNMQDLDEVLAGLGSSIEEFQAASENTNGLEELIGNPDGRRSLRDRVDAFERDWNNNRENLTESLIAVRDHLQGIVDGFRELDTDLATEMSDAQRDLLSNPGPDNIPV